MPTSSSTVASAFAIFVCLSYTAGCTVRPVKKVLVFEDGILQQQFSRRVQFFAIACRLSQWLV